MQPSIKVAIQGQEASFHEIAALHYYRYPIELIYCQSFKQVFEKLANGDADKAFVAVSNSNHGDIDEVSILIHKTNPLIEGEYLLPIHQHLIGLPDTSLRQVRTVVSHPVALSQCSKYLEAHLSHANWLNYHDTSAAVAYVKQLADPSVVAIGSEAAARLHKLTILHQAVQNDTDNATLFKSLSLRPYIG